MGYYQECAFPKPGKKKDKKLYNGYKDKANRVCYYCGAPYAERHEIFCGNNRQISIKYRFQVDLCHEHHEEIQNNITLWAQAENIRLKRKCEIKYIKDKISEGISAKAALKDWMNIIGRNYIEEIMP